MRAALILTVGALAYAAAVGWAGVDFLVTPLAVGSVVVIAGVAGGSRHLIPNGLVLIGWGIGVLAAEHVYPLGGRPRPIWQGSRLESLPHAW